MGHFTQTPPDLYHKSTYTFSVAFQQEFFMAAFYRADINAILRALYKKDTLLVIKEKLSPFTLEEHFTSRWKNLVGFEYTENDGNFKSYPLSDSENYFLPNPDNPENGFNGSQKPMEIHEKLKQVVWNTFLPLTEQPLYFTHINERPYQPVPKKQTIRDKYGKLLLPTHPKFDQAPMAVREGTTVHFTDFTLDGGMGLDTAYCYMIREINNKLEVGEPSSIAGPVQLVDKLVPSALEIRKVTAKLGEPAYGINPAIRFEVLMPPISHRINKYLIYRCQKEVDALSIRTMQLVKTLNLAEITIEEGILNIEDDFQDEQFIPYGETLYYRLVGVKIVEYLDIDDNTVVEEVYSLPSKVIRSNVIDNLNPEPPILEINYEDLNPDYFTNVSFNWEKTTHNATYYLLKMNSFGAWEVVYEAQTNEERISFNLSQPLPKMDEDNQLIYYRFKIVVKNSSGISNLQEVVKTLPAL